MVLESTSYPGTTEELVAPDPRGGVRAWSPGRDFHLGYSPERIDPGNPTWSLENTPKVVSGIDAASLRGGRRASTTGIVERTVPVSGTREAELTKLLENTFRHVNIALVNELAMFAAELDIDVWEAIDAASTKPFGYLRFTPGPGVGGHCLPIDPSYLSWKVRRSLGQPFRFVELANDVNEHMPDYVVRRLILAFNRLGRAVNGSRILLLGPGLQAQHRRRPRGPGHGHRPSRWPPWGPTCGWPIPTWPDEACRYPLVELTADELDGGRRAWSSSPTTTPSTTSWSGPTPRYVLDTRNRLDGPTVERL